MRTLQELEKCIDTANDLGCVVKWIEAFKKDLQEWNKKFPYLASWRLIKQILEGDVKSKP